MSTSVAALPSHGDQELLISTNLNSSMLLNLLMGIYTMVYVNTAYLYLAKRGPTNQRRVVMSSITLLYILCACIFGIEWYYLQWSMVEQGATRDSTFTASASPPVWIVATINTLENTMIIIADGLLIWRCFYVWDGSWRMIGVPLILLLAETALLIPTSFFGTTTQAVKFNNLNSGTMFISAATTIITTVLIGYRIYSVGKFLENGVGIEFSRFKHMMEVFLQSAAVYSVAILANAICIAIPSIQDLRSPTLAAESYLEVFVCIISGMAPTIVAARIIMLNPDNTVLSTVSRISEVQFEAHRNTIRIGTQSGPKAIHAQSTDVEMGEAEL